MSEVKLGKVAFPSYIQDSHEVPQPIKADVPCWSENYFDHGYDPSQDLGFFFHMSRMPFNPNVFEGVFAIYLPGDRYLVARDFSWADDNPKGPGSNALRYEVIKPHQKWSKRFRGAAQLVTGEQMRSGPIADDSHVFVDVDLTWEAAGPIFDIGTDMGTQFWAHFHYEQHGTITGRISFDGTCLGKGKESYEFKGTGLRDHSIGARDVAPMGTHVWTTGHTPSGKLFMIMDVHLKEGDPFIYCILGDKANGFSRVKQTSKSALIEKASQYKDGYEMRFETEDGKKHVLKAEIIKGVPYSFTGPNEWCLGFNSNAHHVLYEGISRFELDGEVCYGLTERSIIPPGK